MKSFDLIIKQRHVVSCILSGLDQGCKLFIRHVPHLIPLMPAQLHQDTAEDQIQPYKHQLRPGMRQFLPASLESLMTQERTEQRTAYRGHAIVPSISQTPPIIDMCILLYVL